MGWKREGRKEGRREGREETGGRKGKEGWGQQESNSKLRWPWLDSSIRRGQMGRLAA